MRRKIEGTAGITLVALVVTIVVLLILAGITLVYVFGDNGVFGKASQAKIQTELKKVEERAQTIYAEKLMETASNNLSTKIETSEVIEQLISEKYPIEKRPVEAGDIKGISLDKENITMGKNKTTEIKVTYEGVDDPLIYYVEVQGKYYQMHSNKGFITIDREASNLTKADFETGEGTEGIIQSLTISSNETDIVEAKLKEGSTSTIEVKALDTEGTAVITVKYGSLEEKTCNVIVRDPILATKITLNETSYIVTGGQSWTNDVQLVATIEPEDADDKEVTWKSSDNSIATVDSKGLVKAGTKGGDVVITVTTKDGTNLSATCTITTELFGKTNSNSISYTDSEGNTAKIPDGFAVGTSDNVNKVTGGLVVQDDAGNQFVWIPVGDFKDKDGNIDHITLGRYKSFGASPALIQNADNYEKVVSTNYAGTAYSFYEAVSPSHIPAKDLKSFILNTKEDGGYYIGRFEASESQDGLAMSMYDKEAADEVTKVEASEKAINVKSTGTYISDMVNSYAFDTAFIFISKCSGNVNYGQQRGKIPTKMKTGKSNDKECNIFDLSENQCEWSTEYGKRSGRGCPLWRLAEVLNLLIIG